MRSSSVPATSTQSSSDVVKHYAAVSNSHKFQLEHSGSPELHADGNKLTQVFENLVSNTVKYSPRGGQIQIRAIQQNKRLQVIIEDQGVGKSPIELERIFDKFYRVDSSDSAAGGLGLGMSIVKTIIEGHNGAIRVESTPVRARPYS